MNAYDVLMIGVVLVGGLLGAWKGVTLQLATVGSLGAGYLVAWPWSAELALKFPGPPWAARGLAFVVLYVVSSGAIFLIAQLTRRVLKRAGMLSFDRHLGMLVGGLAGAAIGLAITLVYVRIAPEARPAIWGSPTGRFASMVWTEIKPAVPEGLRETVDPLVGPDASYAPPLPGVPLPRVDANLRSAGLRYLNESAKNAASPSSSSSPSAPGTGRR